ncbi:MAG TPA: sugar ABC transporter permease [Ruminiclostridium sp.]
MNIQTIQGSTHHKKSIDGIKVWPFIFIVPFFVIYLAFGIFPIIYSFIISFTSWNGFEKPVFIGIQNYINIFTKDPYFIKSIGNTLIFMAIDTPILIVGGIVLAAVFNSRMVKFRGAFRLAIFSPYLTIPVSIGILFALLFDWNSGIINKLLLAVGVVDEGINWLGIPMLARGVICLMIIWKYIGYHMIFFNAAIVAIPMELYEAADVDGATVFQKFIKITVPMLKPIAEFLIIMNIIWGFQLFDEPMVLFSGWISGGAASAVGGPGRSCLTAIWNLYDTTFGTQMQYGKGASIAYGVFLFIIVFAIIGYRVIKGKGKEENE